MASERDRLFPIAVEVVGDNRTFQKGEMDAELVRPAGQQPGFQERMTPVFGFRKIFGYGGAALIGGQDRHHLAAFRVAADWGFDPSVRGRRPAVDERQVAFIDFARFELRLEKNQRFFVLGQDQDPGGVAVEPNMYFFNSLLIAGEVFNYQPTG